MIGLLRGPLNKTLYTHTLELVTKILLYSPEQMNFYYQSPGIGFDIFGLFIKKELHVIIDDVDVNLSQLFSKANFSHIQMDQTEIKKYATYFAPHSHIEMNKIGELKKGEKKAVLSYIGEGYRGINDLLYKSNQRLNQTNNHTTKVNLLTAVILSSGLNKISPSPEDHKIETYRGERHTSWLEIRRRINLVNQGGGVTEQPAFMSTSTSRRISNGFRGNCTIIFDSIYGISIKKAWGSSVEDEYLILPGQIYWKKYEYINGIHTFHAQAVRPLIPAKEKLCAQDIVNFKKLLAFAKNTGVPVNFLTPYLQNVISDPAIPLSKVAPVMKSVTKSTKQKILNGLKAALTAINNFLYAPTRYTIQSSVLVGLLILACSMSYFSVINALILSSFTALSAYTIIRSRNQYFKEAKNNLCAINDSIVVTNNNNREKLDAADKGYQAANSWIVYFKDYLTLNNWKNASYYGAGMKKGFSDKLRKMR